MNTKRIMDLIAALAGLLILSPILLIIALFIKMEDGGPVFYRGERVGKGGVHFKIFKFRTMVPDADKIGGSSTPEDDRRITRLGRILRKYKIDEIAQLINVLKGEMSIVGPRPQVAWAVELYTDEEKLLLTVQPGITDYASLKFSNEDEILKGSKDPDKDYLEKIAPEKNRLAIEYVKHHSVMMDIKIILATIKTIITKSNKGKTL